MKTKFFSKRLRIVAVVFLLLSTFIASTAQADAPIVSGILSAGFSHVCALRPDGSVDCWGDNSNGQAVDQPGPYVQVSAGYLYTCALTPSGAVECWGINNAGQADDQPGPYLQVNATYNYTCALTPIGALDCWGNTALSGVGDQPGPYTQFIPGVFQACAIKPSGSVDCWGTNNHGEADDQSGPYTQITAGTYHYNCGLTPAGAVECWGNNEFGQSTDQPGPYTQVSAGYAHTCALTPSGAADCWGYNVYGEAEDQPGPYIQISAKDRHTCALTPAGAVDCWGYNGFEQAVDQPGPYGAYQPVSDTTPPVVTVIGVTEGSTYILGAVPQAGCSTADDESGVAVEAGLSLSGGNALGVGSFTATCSGALDNAGNSGNTAIVHYNVTFLFTGFSGPVDNPPVINIAKAGQSIPLKWRITDANGTPITNLTSVNLTATSLSCNAAITSDSIEEYATSNSGLHNLGDGYYQWSWRTPASYANSCKTLRLDLGEGTGNEHTALFQFKR